MRATGKPFDIEKKRVYEAYKAVKSNGGAAGVDGQTIEQFEADLKNNLYKIWNSNLYKIWNRVSVRSEPARRV
jgi:retron-type reverse transcriptase